MNISDIILTVIESLGIIAFSISGAMVAIDKRADFFGVIFLACVTATGGGIIRDTMLGHFPPRIFFDMRNVCLAIGSAVAMYFVARHFKLWFKAHHPSINTINNVFDALGLGAFTVMGVEIAVSSGLAENCAAAVFIGMVTGIGGGLLRDLMINEIPVVLKKYIYAIATLIGGLVYFVLALYLEGITAAFVSVAVTFTIRMLATRYRWNLPPAI